MRGRLVEEEDRRIAQEGAGEGKALALASPAPNRPSGLSSERPDAVSRSSSPVRRAASSSAASLAAGAPSRRLLRTVPSTTQGVWPT